MDSVEEAKEYNNNSCSSSCCNNASNNEQGTHAIVKRKRTKRRRLHLPPTSSASSAEFSSGITEEDEDMANCLMLLSRGRNGDPGLESPAEEGVDRGGATEKNTSQKYAEAAATTTDGKHIGLYAYECKTCNKCFPSFQALGGHRASHKKPKTGIPMEEKKAVVDQDGVGLSLSSLSKPDVVPSDGNYVVSGGSNKMRVHECSICGSEFPSGQALGGHMRRHRPLMTTTETPELKKERSVLSLDLNLPAPSDDDREELPTFPTSTSVAFPFESKQLALVDCHY